MKTSLEEKADAAKRKRRNTMPDRLKDTLLLVGDAKSDRVNLRKIFSSSYNLLEAENSTQAIMLLEQNRNCIAAVLADLSSDSGDDLKAMIAANRAGTADEIPIIVLITPTGTGVREEQVFLQGATDVVYKIPRWESSGAYKCWWISSCTAGIWTSLWKSRARPFEMPIRS